MTACSFLPPCASRIEQITRHGHPAAFETSLSRAVADGFSTAAEANAASERYRADYRRGSCVEEPGITSRSPAAQTADRSHDGDARRSSSRFIAGGSSETGDTRDRSLSGGSESEPRSTTAPAESSSTATLSTRGAT
jgi:hypothetical protein